MSADEQASVTPLPRRERWDRVVSTACTGWPRGVCGPGYPADHDECRTPRCACRCHAVEEIEPPDQGNADEQAREVEAVARAFYIASNADDREWAARAWDDMGGSEPSAERADLEVAMREALAALEPVRAAERQEAAREALLAALDDLVPLPHSCFRPQGCSICGRVKERQDIRGRLRARADGVTGPCEG